MKTVKISLNSIDKVKSFVNDITKFDYDFDLVSGRYVIDAKSIMGIFSLDLSKPIDLNIHVEDNVDEIISSLSPTHIVSVVSIAVCTSSSILSSRCVSLRLMILIFGFVTGCFATKIVQQSSKGWMEVS